MAYFLISLTPKFSTMKKLILLFTAVLLIGSAYAQTQKTKEGGEKVKVSDDKIKIKDADGNKTKIKAPAPVIKQFTEDFPEITGATWSSSKGSWTATYKLDGMETSTTYHANGKRLHTKTLYPMDHLPDVIVTYQQNTPAFKIGKVYKISTPGQEDVYEVMSADGKTVYVDANGNETKYSPIQ
jgi:hypothetical protein